QGPGGARGRGGPGTAGAVTMAARSAQLGATCSDEGVNFSLFSRHATGVALLLFEGVDDPRPSQEIRLDPTANRTYFYWHVFVPGVRSGQLDGDRVEVPCDAGTAVQFTRMKDLHA